MSYLRRLAERNRITAQELQDHIAARVHRNGRRFTELRIESLAMVSGLPAAHLAYALPEIRDRFAGHRGLHVTGRTIPADPNRRGLPCRRCAAARGVEGHVTVWIRHDNAVCQRHHLWIGGGVQQPSDQLDVSDLPEIGAAQVRHTNLARRHGHQQANHFYESAVEISDWSSRGRDPGSSRTHRNQHFLERQQATRLPWSYDNAAHYPEVVGVLSVICSPSWRRSALSDHQAEREAFYEALTRNGLTNGDPRRNSALRYWLDLQRRR
jgi:hypothetical protein